ncbi:hypothetical protein DFJ77DRAFT_501867 [Powellomyces hirtus]|nr:hypothetical protein DFJ77DRAFT_501867 [Powellomyces hirtus]
MAVFIRPSLCSRTRLSRSISNWSLASTVPTQKSSSKLSHLVTAYNAVAEHLPCKRARLSSFRPHQLRSYSASHSSTPWSPVHASSSPRIITTIAEYRAVRQHWQREGKSVGFVPTMGALHAGHVSLAKLARQQCDKVVASIFVNPAQFAPTEDLAKYPRTQERDVEMLAEQGVDVIFIPAVKEMYPAGIVLDVSDQRGTFVEVKGKSHQMEGSIRPHFFRGVATVVTKLFNIMQPTKAYFGQKDAQQCAVIRSMVRDLFVPTEIVVGETMREKDGLAMSSRNRYLSPEERAIAPVLYKALSAGAAAFHEKGITRKDELVAIAKGIIETQEGVHLEYLSLADPFSLEELDSIGLNGAIFSGAVRVGKTRIIDNCLLGVTTDKWVA